MRTSTIAVVVLTRGRPQGCARTVAAVLDQAVPPGCVVRVVVVDNNDLPGEVDVPTDDRIEVVREPVAGISNARNRGIDAALPEADIVVFIDDDEIPGERWLAELLKPLLTGRAEVATGPVRSVFHSETPGWIRRQPIFRSRDNEDGAEVSEAYTGNVAAQASVYDESNVWFRSEFGKTGGEDTEFFRRVYRAGNRILWVATAVVDELVPPDRATPRWILARSLRIGANRAQFLRMERASFFRWIAFLVGSIGEITLLVPGTLCCFFSRRQALWLLARAARGCGFLLGLAGRNIQPYG